MQHDDSKIRRWSDLISEAEIQAYAKAGFGQKIGIGERPALLNIDTTNNFVDPAYALCAARCTARQLCPRDGSIPPDEPTNLL
jgi:hypothetical protein